MRQRYYIVDEQPRKNIFLADVLFLIHLLVLHI